MGGGGITIVRNSNNRMMVGYQQTDSTVTGTTSETILVNAAIPAGAMGPNDVLWIEALFYSVGTAGTKTYKAYVGPTSNSLVGATQIGTIQLNATQLTSAFLRRMANKNSLSSNNVMNSATSAASDLGGQTVARSSINANFANNQFIMITCQLANTGDTGGIDNVQIYINKP